MAPSALSPRLPAGGSALAGASGAFRRRPSSKGLALSAALAAVCTAGLVSAFAFAFTPAGSGRGPRLGTSSQARSAVALQAEGHSKWRLGVGRAIDILRTDAVALFERRERPLDFSIFSEDIEVVDERLPSFRLKGLATYQRILSTLRWSVITAFDKSLFEITTTTAPVNNEVRMRWKLHLVPRDPLAPAKGLFLGPLGGAGGGLDGGLSGSIGLPFTVEGYSRYEFHPFTAEIVKHTIDITNPPMYLNDLISGYVPTLAWLSPAPTGLRVPAVMPVQTTPQLALAGASGVADVPSLPLTGATHGAGAGAAASVAAPQLARAGLAGRAAGSWFPSMPQSCEDDFECNDGKANFPLQCCELPLLGKFCCEPDDSDALPQPQNPAFVPLPVPVEEPWK